MQQISEKVRQKLSLLPELPGVYLMKDKEGKIIYVGKALVLKNRIKSYFTGQFNDLKTEKLVSNIDDLEYIIVNTESEAFILESNLIKKYQPHYNILLKDDKKYPFLKVTYNEVFPRIMVTRDIIKDGAKYYGPYTDVKYLRSTLRTLEWLFPHRTCTRNIPESPVIYKRACLNYQMKKCPAPCIGEISKSDYRRIIQRISNFLIGKNQDLIKDLTDEMYQASEEMLFEKAAALRDQIREIERIQKSQTMHFPDEKNRDIISVYQDENLSAVAVLKIISGKMSSKEIYSFKNTEYESKNSLIAAFLSQYYAPKTDDLPYRIIVQEAPDNLEELQNFLQKRIVVPQRGEFKQLIKLAEKNAFDYIENQKLSHLRKSSRTIFPVQELKDKLNLYKLPRRMVCMDISTIQGTDTVSSIVFFENGKPLKKQYKHFIMKTVEGQDDFASMAETMNRYLKHFYGSSEKHEHEESDKQDACSTTIEDKLDLNEQDACSTTKDTKEQDNWLKPDLIVIDGGKGQLSSALRILQENQAQDIEIISLAKRVEEVFLPNQSESIFLPRNSSALRLLINIRDEAHRFAITFHRKRRSTRTLSSQLDEIKGIGTEKKLALLKHFGSVDAISKAEVSQLCQVKGIGESFAKIVWDFFHQKV
ncbi:MAG TPA: excinuclease ABC subunit UvrC [Candidatus Cloacimonadota bacterium]|nr:excinuclease ABC subunit UvrC [Candidatus Cloacimonadota bacterium]